MIFGNDNFSMNWKMSADDIINATNELINNSINRNKQLLQLDINKSNIKHFLTILADDITEYTTFHSFCSFLQYVSPDNKVKNSCDIADLTLTKYINELNSRRDIYDKICDFYNAFRDDITSDDHQFLKKIIEYYEREGINMDPVKRDLVLKVKQEISKLENYIIQYVYKFETQLIGLDKQELEGLPTNFLNMLSIVNKSQGKYGITLNKDNYNICMSYIKNDKIRKNLELFYCTASFKIIDKTIKMIILKDKYAKLLGFNNYSDYRNTKSMAGNSENIKEFLLNLLEKFNYRYFKEIGTLLKIKKYDQKNNNINLDLNSWDIEYYITKWKQEYGLDEQVIKEYFPLKHVIKVLINEYERIFNLKFIKIKDKPTWYKDVLTYAVHDMNSIKKEVIGYIYLDLFSRENKYKQIRCFVLRPACPYPYNSSKNENPIIALTTFFNKNDQLLTHNDVLSLSHEFGHIVHYIYAKSKYCILSGANIQHDFIEVPAKVMEDLCWNKDILKKLSKHYKTNKSLSDEIIDKMIKIRDLNIGIFFKKQILIALYDQLVYSSDNLISMCETIIKNNNNVNDKLISTITVLYKQLFQKVLPNVNINDNMLLPLEWINIVHLNDARYYDSVWSKICAGDIINTKCKNGFTSTFGQEFKNNILKYGNVDATELVNNYLGKRSSLSGFFELYSLDTDVEYSFFFNSDKFNKDIKNTQTNEIQHLSDPEAITDTEQSNRFTEINSENSEDNVVQNTTNHIKNKLNIIPNDNSYNENTESLKRYKNIFI